MEEATRTPWLTERGPAFRCLQRPEGRLRWEQSVPGPDFIIDHVLRSREWIDLGFFSSALRSAGLFDNLGCTLPGAVIALAKGQSLVRLFSRLVREHYDRAGLAEFDYPCIASITDLGPFDEVFPSRHRVLYVGTQDDLERREPRAFLLPTGEPIIYSHWRRSVRRASDLPIQMYRCARFLRPWSASKTGRTIFNSLEGVDTFEFHCCYEPSQVKAAAERLYAMLRSLVSHLCLPVLWSTRPPWTNHGQVSRATIGGDAPLPSGTSLQIATMYDQGTIFSDQFKILYEDERGSRRAPHHLTGAVSRRLLITHLLFGMFTDGCFQVHPHLSPCQVQVVVRHTERDSVGTLSEFARDLESRDIRVATTIADSRKELARALRRGKQLLAPLTVVLWGRRSADDKVRVMLRRNDTAAELRLEADDLTSIPSGVVHDALADIAADQAWRAVVYLSGRCLEAQATDVRDLLTNRYVAIAPLRFDAETVSVVSGWKQGEVLGFLANPEPQSCIITGQPTKTWAYLSPRC
jgi:hypothetical protein